jgi:prepilin-type N-terminal cleavage/methylation domain-containing protein
VKSGVRRAFTLIEILIVVLVIGILLAIAVPSFVRARESSRARGCIANLKLIDSAKEQYALDHGTRNGVTIQLTWLIGTYIKGNVYANSSAQSRSEEFRCPATNLMYGSGMGAIGTPPQCPSASYRTGPFPHALP